MAGTLYVIGVGPGDPELITLKGARILASVGSICVPKGREEGSSLALSIVEKAVNLEGKEIVEVFFPMQRTDGPGAGEVEARWNEAARLILERLARGTDVAFVTIGDPAFYSTFFYLYDRLLGADPGLAVEIVPGVTSISACASLARVYLGLGSDRIAVMPANRAGDLKAVLGAFDTVVLMKVGSSMDKVVAALAEAGLLEKGVCVSRAGLPGERVWADLASVKPGDLDYFSVVIVKK